MIRALCQCKQVLYIDEQTGHKFADNSASMLHRCQPQLIPLYNEIYGIKVRRSEASIALAITDEAMRLGIDPFRARSRRKGDYLEVFA